MARAVPGPARRPPEARRKGPRLTTEIARLFPARGQWTEADFLALPDTNRIVELSEGRLVVPDVPTDAHQYTSAELYSAMRAFVLARKLGHLRYAPLRVRLWPGKLREPDLVFLSKSHEDRRGEDYWGVPDLVAEVVSPRTSQSSGTERADRREKFEEYAHAGVLEYWIVDPVSRAVEVYVLRDGVYLLLGKWATDGAARSEILQGFSVPVASLFEG